jgi:uncharacterized protein DUF4231
VGTTRGFRWRERAPVLLKRWPRLNSAFAVEDPVPAERQPDFPALETDFSDLREIVVPRLREQDRAALTEQNWHRRQQVLLMTVSAATSLGGAVQAALPGSPVPGTVTAFLGVVAAGVARHIGERKTLRKFQESRRRAESLRSLYFRYLTRTPPFHEGNRRAALMVAVIDVEEPVPGHG